MNKRFIVSIVLLAVCFLIWLPSSQIIELIITNEEIVLGRYSRGRFGILLLLTIVLLIVASGFFNKPRYIEQDISGVDADTGIALSGVVRHRPPQERFDLVQKDVPEQLRSYPNAPAG